MKIADLIKKLHYEMVLQKISLHDSIVDMLFTLEDGGYS